VVDDSPTDEEWLELIGAECSCGWDGPDRTGDPRDVDLVLDDCAWHCHEVGIVCPDTARCFTCTPEVWREH
jgi:hypothetical protein